MRARCEGALFAPASIATDSTLPSIHERSIDELFQRKCGLVKAIVVLVPQAFITPGDGTARLAPDIGVDDGAISERALNADGNMVARE